MSNISKPGGGGGLEDGENFDGQGTSDFTALNSVGTDSLIGGYVGDVRAVADGEVIASIDPSTTATPVNDAIDEIVSNTTTGVGTVYLPPGTVTDDGPIQMAEGVSLIGHGIGNVSGQKNSAIQIGTAGTVGLDFGSRGAAAGDMKIDGFALIGQGDDAAYAPAMKVHDYDTPGIKIGHIQVVDWYGEAFLSDGSAATFQCVLGEWFQVRNVDAGDQDGLIDIRNGVQNKMEMLAAYPSATTSAANTTVLYLNLGELTVDRLNIGGSAGRILWKGNDRIHGGTVIGPANWEPSALQSTPDHLYRIQGHGTEVKTPVVNGASGADVTDVYRLSWNNGDLDLARPRTANGGVINGDPVKVSEDTDFTSVYRGESADVNNNTGGTLSNAISCLGDLVSKTSTGTGP